MGISRRKDEHLELCLTQNVNSNSTHFWDGVSMPHRALPELDFDQIDLTSSFLNFKFNFPILISSMTGGTEGSEKINYTLAELSQNKNIPMGVGSHRVVLKSKSHEYFQLKKRFPKSTIWANLGMVQFNYGVSIDDCLQLIEQTQASAFILHLNPLQEAIQKEGDRNFSGLLKKTSEFKKRLGSIPLIVKETGCGLSSQDCIRLKEAGVDALDIAGLGGTHWGFIEGLRSEERRALGDMFRNWGIPTPQALMEARKALGTTFPIIASGGIRHGLDGAKALYLGADLFGLAKPFLVKAQEGYESLEKFFDMQAEALRIALFSSGNRNVKEFK